MSCTCVERQVFPPNVPAAGSSQGFCEESYVSQPFTSAAYFVPTGTTSFRRLVCPWINSKQHHLSPVYIGRFFILRSHKRPPITMPAAGGFFRKGVKSEKLSMERVPNTRYIVTSFTSLVVSFTGSCCHIRTRERAPLATCIDSEWSAAKQVDPVQAVLLKRPHVRQCPSAGRQEHSMYRKDPKPFRNSVPRQKKMLAPERETCRTETRTEIL